MRLDTLEFLRCPHCGGVLRTRDGAFQERTGDALVHGLLVCHCCAFAVVDGIPVMHTRPDAEAARRHLESGRPDLARRVLFGFADSDVAERFESAVASPGATYASLVHAIGQSYEDRYFLHRFSDPSYLVVDAVVRAVGGWALGGTGRAIDVCGGSGHVARALSVVTRTPVVLTDLYFAKLWLARRFVAPTCEPICSDANRPLPVARGRFAFALCADALMFVWPKRAFIAELERLVDGVGQRGAVAITHTHNQRVWSPSHGDALSPEAYARLFESLPVRVYSEGRLLHEVVAEQALDLARTDAPETLDADPALVLLASRDEAVFARHLAPAPHGPSRGVYRINPLYDVTARGERLHLRLAFPNAAYEEEFGHCREYLPATATLNRGAVERLQAGGPPDELADAIRQRVVLDLPPRYC